MSIGPLYDIAPLQKAPDPLGGDPIFKTRRVRRKSANLKKRLSRNEMKFANRTETKMAQSSSGVRLIGRWLKG